jgi:hypothetical protein
MSLKVVEELQTLEILHGENLIKIRKGNVLKPKSKYEVRSTKYETQSSKWTKGL